MQNHNCIRYHSIMSTVHPDRLQRRVCANQKQTVRFLYSPRLSFLLAQVEVSDNCRHKLVDQSLAPSEKAAISSMFSSWGGLLNSPIRTYLYITVIRKYNTYIEPLLDNECICSNHYSQWPFSIFTFTLFFNAGLRLLAPCHGLLHNYPVLNMFNISFLLHW